MSWGCVWEKSNVSSAAYAGAVNTISSGGSLINLSKFNAYVLYIGDNANVTYDSIVIPYELLKKYQSATNAFAIGIDLMRINARRYALLTYKSDTQIYIQISAQTSCSLYVLC